MIREVGADVQPAALLDEVQVVAAVSRTDRGKSPAGANGPAVQEKVGNARRAVHLEKVGVPRAVNLDLPADLDVLQFRYRRNREQARDRQCPFPTRP